MVVGAERLRLIDKALCGVTAEGIANVEAVGQTRITICGEGEGGAGFE